jgi:type II secretory pathway predicted ATPase ExeA
MAMRRRPEARSFASRASSQENRLVHTRATEVQSTRDWKLYWGFDRAPFAEHDSPYVPLPTHDEAALRLVDCVESGQRSAYLTADAGLGKTTVLRRVLVETRNVRRRAVLVSCRREADLLLAALADRLGERVGREPTRLACWRAIERAFRLASIQGIHLVIGIDDCESASAHVRRDIEALGNLWTGLNTRLTVIQAGGPRPALRSDRTRPWAPTIRLESLTRSEAECYLITKLAGAGCGEPVFTPRAVTRLHCLSSGVPRGIEQLATHCLMLGAVRGLEAIPPELVDTVDEENEAARE